MKIKDYLNPPKGKLAIRKELAEKLGVSEIAAKKWAQGNRHPRRSMWPDIVKATDGKVSIHDLATG